MQKIEISMKLEIHEDTDADYLLKKLKEFVIDNCPKGNELNIEIKKDD